MILNRLELENFKIYRKKSFNFELGLTGLIGKNGSGKSSIFEAIIFALYAETKTKKELLKNSNATKKEPLVVRLEFNIDGKDYLIVRELRGASLNAKAYLYRGDELIASSTKGVNSEIVKLIGMSKDAFSNTIYASQKELSALSTIKSEERKKIIRKLLGLEKIDKIELELINNIRDLKRDIKSFKEVITPKDVIEELKKSQKKLLQEDKIIQEEILKLEKNLEQIEDSLKNAKQKVEYFDGLNKEYNSIKNAIDIGKTKIKNLRKNLQKLQNNLSNLQHQEDFFNKNSYKLQEYNTLLKEIEALQKQKELIIEKEGLEKEQKRFREQLKQIKKEIKVLETEIKSQDEILALEDSLQKELTSLQQELKSLQDREQHLLNIQFTHKTTIKNTKNQLTKIEQLGKDSPCPTCTRALLDEYDKVVNSLKDTIKDLTDNALFEIKKNLQEIEKIKQKLLKKEKTLNNKLKDIFAKKRLIENANEQIKNKLTLYETIKQKGLSNKKRLESLQNIVYDSTKHNNLLQQKEELKKEVDRLIGIKKLIEQIPTLQKEIKDTTLSINNQQKQNIVLEDSLKKINYNPKDEKIAKDEYQKWLTKKDKITNDLHQLKLKKGKIESKIEEIENRLNEHKKHLDILQNKQKEQLLLEKLKLFISDFKTKINNQIAPRISHYASELFFEITKGKYQFIEVDDDFNFFIYDEGRRYPIERFSGGEIDLANLVLRIAISKTINELNSSKNISFLAFDEIFGSQDENRRYAIMESLNKISENYRQIFLISHEQEIKEMFERVIELSA